MTDLAKLVVALEAETSRYQKELEKAKRQLGTFEKSANAAVSKIATAAGAAALTAAASFVAMTKAAIDSADEMNKLAQSTGIATEDLSELAYAADLSGTSFEDLQTSLAKLSKTAAEAARGTGSQAKAFEQLGISASNADGSLKGTEQLMLEIADRFAQYEDGAGKAAIAQEIFGRSGARLIPFLNQGSAGIQKLKDEAAALGLTIGSDTARSAEAFNDNLTRLKSAAVGFANQVATQLLPFLENLSGQFAESAMNANAFEDAARVAATAIKLLVSAGLVVAEVFDRVGSYIGAAAAALVRIANRDFKGAFNTIKEYSADSVDSVSETAKQIAAVWDDSGQQIAKTAQQTDQQLKNSLSFGGKGDSPVQEVQVTAKRIETGAIDQLNQEMLAATQTQLDAQRAAYHADKAMLDDLLAQKLISVEQYNERIGESFDQFLPEFEVTVKKMKEVAETGNKELSEFQKQAARNTQDIIANTLRNGFDEGADGILRSFADMLKDLVAQAIAADIAGKLFGSSVTGNSSDGGGWVGTALSAIGSIFGGTMDSGGRGSPGTAYAIGTGAQPEMFIPDSAGTFVPRDRWGGGTSVSNTFVIQTPSGRVPLETQQQIATRTAQALAQAQRRNG